MFSKKKSEESQAETTGTSEKQLSNAITGLFWRNLILAASLLIHRRPE